MSRRGLTIRLPNWLGDVVMALPVVRAVARENADVRLRGQAVFAPLLMQFGMTLSYETLPAKGFGYYPYFLRRREKRDALLFANSQRSDLEAWLSGAPLRFGISWPARPRRLLNRHYQISHPEQDGCRHQTELWADFTAYFQLQQGIDRTPFVLPAAKTNTVVFIAGSENNPEKRWPAARFRQLAERVLAETDWQIVLTGTANDRGLADSIAAGLPAARVRNAAGETALAGFVEILAAAQAVIGNDTGGLHLANACGTPAIGLYGPTNPERTRPIFEAPLAVVQPDGCPPSGGSAMAGISTEAVWRAVQHMLEA